MPIRWVVIRLIEYAPFFDKESFVSAVSALFSVHAPADERMDVVRRMTDAYFRMFGDYPMPGQLSRLGSYILRECDGKKTVRAKGHLTKWQIKRRLNRESPMDINKTTLCLEHKLYGKHMPKLTSDEVMK